MFLPVTTPMACPVRVAVRKVGPQRGSKSTYRAGNLIPQPRPESPRDLAFVTVYVRTLGPARAPPANAAGSTTNALSQLASAVGTGPRSTGKSRPEHAERVGDFHGGPSDQGDQDTSARCPLDVAFGHPPLRRVSAATCRRPKSRPEFVDKFRGDRAPPMGGPFQDIASLHN